MQWWTLEMIAHRPPGRPSTIQISHNGRWRSSSCDISRPIRRVELALQPRWGEGRVADVVHEVEVGVVDPDGAAEAPGDEAHLLAVAGEERKLAGHRRDELVVRRGRALEDGARTDVHVGDAVLHVEEEAVERAHVFHRSSSLDDHVDVSRTAGRPPLGASAGRGWWRRRGRHAVTARARRRVPTSRRGSRTGSCAPPSRSTSSNPSLHAVGEHLRIGHRRGVDGHADAAGACVRQQGDVHRGADGRTERDVALDARAGEVHREGKAWDVAGDEVDVLEHAADDAGWQDVEAGGDGVRVRQGPLLAGAAAASLHLPDAGRGIRIARRDREPHQRDAVSPDRVVRRPDADGHGDPQLVDRGSVALVVPAQAAGDRGHEPVVDRPASGRRRPLQIGQRRPRASRGRRAWLRSFMSGESVVAQGRDGASDRPHRPGRRPWRSPPGGASPAARPAGPSRVPDAMIPNVRPSCRTTLPRGSGRPPPAAPRQGRSTSGTGAQWPPSS